MSDPLDNLDSNLESLRNHIAFQELIEALEDIWRDFTQDLYTCPLEDVERKIGKMQAHRELLDMFRGDSA